MCGPQHRLLAPGVAKVSSESATGTAGKYQLYWYATHRSQTTLLYRGTSEQATNQRYDALDPRLR